MKKLFYAILLCSATAFAACSSESNKDGADTSAAGDTTTMDHTMTDTASVDTVRRDSADNRRIDTAAKTQP